LPTKVCNLELKTECALELMVQIESSFCNKTTATATKKAGFAWG